MTKIAEKEITTKQSYPMAGVSQNAGLENGDSADIILPRILLIQKMSKFVEEHGSVPGTFVNSLTLKTSEEIEFVPAVYVKYFDLYDVSNPEDVQFVARCFDKEDPRLEGKRFFADKKLKLKAEVSTVMSFISLVDGEPAIIPFAKSSYPAGKKLYTLAKFSNAPLFSRKYKLTARKETNEKATYYVKEVDLIGEATEQEATKAHEVYKTFSKKAQDIQPAGIEGEEVPF